MGIETGGLSPSTRTALLSDLERTLHVSKGTAEKLVGQIINSLDADRVSGSCGREPRDLAAASVRPQREPSTDPAHMSISQSGIKMIEGFEGLDLHAYQDSSGVWTIGYGHTGGVYPGESITQAQAQKYLESDLGWAEQAVRDNVHVPLTQNQFNALTSLTYNLGPSGYPTLLHALNSGNYAAAQRDFHLYVHDGSGQVLQGLVTRRDTEAALFGDKGPAGTQTHPHPTHPYPAHDHSHGHGHDASSNYTVRSGDTLWSIAQAHGVSLQALEAANTQIHDPNLIYVGETVHLPGASDAAATLTYTVQSGDTMSGIAARYGVSLRALERANPQVTNPNLIFVGQQLHIPGATQAAHPVAPVISPPLRGAPISTRQPQPVHVDGHASTDRAAIYMAQPNGWSCAATSLTMAIAAWGKAPSDSATWNTVVRDTGDNSSEGLPGNASLLGPTAEKFGLHAEYNASTSPAAVRAALAEGRTVIYNGSLGIGGHFVYIAGVNKNGTFDVFDPAGVYTSMTDAQLEAFNAAGSHPPGFEEIWR